MEYEKLGSLAHFINGFAFKPEDWSSKGKKIIRIQNLTDLNKEFNYTERIVPDKYIVNRGDVLVSWSATIDVFIWNYDEQALLNQHIFKVIFDDAIVFKNYFIFALKHTIYELNKLAHGSTMRHIVKGEFENHKIPLPPYADQIRIANVLCKIEDVIKARKNAIDQLDELVKATFYDMFGDPLKNEKGWKKEEIKYFGKVITGNTPKRNINEYYDNQYIEWIKTDNIVSNKIYLSEAKEYLSELGLEVGRFIEEGGLLINCIAGSKKSIGKIAIANRKVAFNQQINAIQLHQNIEPLFMYWLINISNEYIQSFASGTMKFILSKSAFEKIELIKPEPSNQIQFASIAQKIEKLKAEQEKQLLEMESLYASVSHAAFSGTLDLTRIPYDDSLLPEEKVKIDLSDIDSPIVIKPQEEVKIDLGEDDTPINITPDEEVYIKLSKPDFGYKILDHYDDWKDLSFSIIADIIKNKFKNHYFNAEMLLNCLNLEEKINVVYYTSAEKKKKPELDNDEDFYGFIQSTLTGSNPFLKLEQVFYNAEEENIKDISFREIDLDLLAKKERKDRSGIYFRILK